MAIDRLLLGPLGGRRTAMPFSVEGTEFVGAVRRVRRVREASRGGEARVTRRPAGHPEADATAADTGGRGRKQVQAAATGVAKEAGLLAIVEPDAAAVGLRAVPIAMVGEAGAKASTVPAIVAPVVGAAPTESMSEGRRAVAATATVPTSDAGAGTAAREAPGRVAGAAS